MQIDSKDRRNTPTHLEIGAKDPYKDEAPKKNGNNTRDFIVFLSVHHRSPTALRSLYLTIA